MMSTCSDVRDDLADLLTGDKDAIERHAEHLAMCDECRDLRHEATELAAAVVAAASDFKPSPNLKQELLAALKELPPVPDTTELAAKVARAEAAKPKQIEKKPTPAIETERPLRSSPRRPGSRPRAALWGGLAAATVVAGLGIWKLKQPSERTSSSPSGAAHAPEVKDGIGAVTQVARAAADGGGGVQVKTSGAWRALAKGQQIPAGATVKTDERTRVGVRLADGTVLVLDHGTELAFDAKEPRAMTLTAGRLSADVAHVEGRAAAIATPVGKIDVIGTKLVVTATDALTSVQVVRGTVAVTTTAGQRDEVHAGEEGTIEKGTLNVASAPGLARELGWSELEKPVQQDELPAGLGSLRAYKPGETRDRDWNLALAKHDVKVRIVGPIARTEITETFKNDSAETLEGVYKFPLPADAQIDGLSLDVDGGYVEGAFVDKTRAQRIFQGVIDKASPVQIARAPEEIIWVPGRWRDPALLDWKRGGRFELKIFPIPAKGQRTVKLSYTQVVTPRGPFREYTYPLAHSTDGSTAAGNFTVDLEVRGAMPGVVRAQNYALAFDGTRKDQNAMTFAQASFVPRGDLVVDYRPVDGDAELRAWTFTGGAAVAPDEKLAAKKGVGVDPKVVEEQRAVAADARPTAVLALRPQLPRWRETRPHDFVIVLDSSQSMVGERWTRASELALAMIDQMDRRDRFSVAACDSECAKLGDLRAPGAGAVAEAKKWLAAQTAAGASDVVGSLRAAADFGAGTGTDREKWILYIGDGFATSGFRKSGDVEKAVAGLAATGVHVTTIGIGQDADLALLAAAARGGGGSYLAWVPGESTPMAAIAAIESTNGAQLRNATVELPAGLADVAPTVLPTIRSGEEVLLAARVGASVKGDVVIKGEVGGKPFEQRYPLDLKVSTAAGNGFVPRLWASLAIEQLERKGDGETRPKIVALSQGYGVMSRETSLLVLESQAMFDAFGVDRGSAGAKWTGEQDLDETVTAGTVPVVAAQPAQAAGDAGGATGTAAVSTTAPAAAAPVATPTPMPTSKAGKKDSDRSDPYAADEKAGNAAADKAKAERPEQKVAPARAKEPAPPPPPAKKPMAEPTNGVGRKGTMGAGGGAGLVDSAGFDNTRSGMVAMRRTWVRVPSVTAYDGVSEQIKKVIASSEAALAANPNSREKHRALVQVLAYAGELDRARDVANKWLDRDRLDPAALGYEADLLGRDGQRELALRTLAGLVDLDPDRAALHERMVKAYETAGRLSQACAERISLSALAPKDAAVGGAALRCLRSIGRDADADLVAGDLADDATRTAAQKAAAIPGSTPRVSGDLVVSAKWQANADLDISVITPSGERVSWMGGRADAVVGDASSTDREQLALRSLKRGNYLIEIARGNATTGAIRGTVEVTVLGTKKTLPFELSSSHAVVARLAVNLEERLEQISDNGMIGMEPNVQVGSSGNDSVDRVVRARVGIYRACYLKELSRTPGIRGAIQAQIMIDDSGIVAQVFLGGAQMSGVNECLTLNLQRLRFPASASGTYRVPMRFNFQ